MPALAGVTWTTRGILQQVETAAYRAWMDDYLAIMGAHTTYAAFKSMADPGKIPKAVASDVLRDASAGRVRQAAETARKAGQVKGSAVANGLVDAMGLGAKLAERERE